jgi:DNA-binding CsgD family transcriptional regulator
MGVAPRPVFLLQRVENVMEMLNVRQILRHWAQGASKRTIADIMGVSSNTLRTLLTKCHVKLYPVHTPHHDDWRAWQDTRTGILTTLTPHTPPHPTNSPLDKHTVT